MMISLFTDSAIVEYFLAISSALLTTASELPRTFIRGCKTTFLNQEVLSKYSSTSPSAVHSNEISASLNRFIAHSTIMWMHVLIDMRYASSGVIMFGWPYSAGGAEKSISVPFSQRVWP